MLFLTRNAFFKMKKVFCLNIPPFVLLAAAFSAGLVVAYTELPGRPALGLAAAAVFGVIALVKFLRGVDKIPFFLFLSLFFLGWSWAGLSLVTLPDALNSFVGHHVILRGTLECPPVFYSNRAVFTLDDPGITCGTETWHGSVKIQAVFYYPDDLLGGRESQDLKRERELLGVMLPGDRAAFKGRLDLPPQAGNPGEFDYRAYLARQGVVAQLKTFDIPVLDASGYDHRYLIKRFLAGLRFRIENGIESALPAEQAAFLKGLLLGAKEGMTLEDRETYQRTGVMHLFAVSGFNLAFVMVFLYSIASLLRLKPYASFLFISIGLWGYAALISFPPSVTRAAVMGTAGLAAYYWQQRQNLINSLALAAFVILLFDPTAVLDPGFQFSFAATWGIMYLAGSLSAYFPQGVKGVGELVSATFAAQLAVFPLTALYFQQISVIGLIANLLAVPLAGIAVNLGLAGMLLTLFFSGSGSPFFIGAGALISPINFILSFLSEFPGGTLLVPAPSWWLVALWFVFLVVLGWSVRGHVVIFPHFLFRAWPRRWFFPSLAGLVLTAVFIGWGQGCSPAGSSSMLKVTFINVGQGDAILLEMPNGRRMLVDGGGKPAFSSSGFEPGSQIVVPYLVRNGIRGLDLVVNTHPHEDHLGGLPAVVKRLHVGCVCVSPVCPLSPAWSEPGKLLHRKKIPVHELQRGASLQLDPRVEIRVINPPARLYKGTRSDLNNNSVVLYVRYASVAFLLTGDIEQEAIDDLVASSEKNRLRALVLKAPHHGSSASISPAFADLVRPRFVVISVGPNSFGHPAPETLKFWREKGAVILRTDESGAIVFETDGRKLFLKTDRSKGSQSPKLIPMDRAA